MKLLLANWLLETIKPQKRRWPHIDVLKGQEKAILRFLFLLKEHECSWEQWFWKLSDTVHAKRVITLKTVIK